MPEPDQAGPAPQTQTSVAPPIRAMIVGAPKAGTTSLYRYAVQHPGLASHTQREMTYFFSDPEYARGYDACMNKYLPGGAAPGSLFFAKHVFAMYRDEAVARLKARSPSAHVFVLLRDPVRRAYSSYWYSRRRGWDPAGSFAEAVRWELDRPGEDDQWLTDRDRMHLRVGLYHGPVQRLRETFGGDRVHVYLTDDLTQDAAGLCRGIYELLGLDTGFTPDLTRTHNPSAAARSQAVARTMAGALKSRGKLKRTIRRFIPHSLARRARHALLRVNEKPFTPPPMPDDMRRRLTDYFAPHNQMLGRLIGRDLSAWSDV